jgi:hypothetical protein
MAWREEGEDEDVIGEEGVVDVATVDDALPAVVVAPEGTMNALWGRPAPPYPAGGGGGALYTVIEILDEVAVLP